MVLNDVPENALRTMLANDLSAARSTLDAADSPPGIQTDSSGNQVLAVRTEQWDSLGDAMADCSLDDSDPTNTLVGPLLETRWSQWRHYNTAYPEDPAPGEGYDGRAPAGCVPVIGAQLTRFYSWPPYGQEGHITVDDNVSNLISGVFEADFRGVYDWINMLAAYDPYNAEPSNAVAAVSKLIHDLGVGVDIDYGSYISGGSFAYMDSLNSRLSRSFFYERGVSIVRADDAAAFDQAVREEILARRPVVAAVPGHAVIVDGYSEDAGLEFFHINYGWGGQNDGWFHLSDIDGDGLRSAIVRLVPRPVPLLEKGRGGTNISGRIELAWHFPDCQRPRLTGYRILEGSLHATNIVDHADHLDAWMGDHPPWTVAAEGSPGNCFRKSGQQGRHLLTLRPFVKPAAAAMLEFDYKAALIDDHFYVKTSIDGGYTWTIEKHFTKTEWDTDWHWTAVDLSAYVGRETLIRFEYVLESGSYWPNGGVWLDNIRIRDIEAVAWTVARDGIAPDATTATIDGRMDGCYYHSVEAIHGIEPLAGSPPLPTIVAISPDLDMDGDGILNGWETLYFGGPTGAVAIADDDLDGVSNLAEYLAGTHPRDEDSYFRLRTFERDPGGWSVSWPSLSNRIYTLWFSTNLTDIDAGFTALASNLPATPPINRFVDEGASARPCGFYMIEVQPEP